MIFIVVLQIIQKEKIFWIIYIIVIIIKQFLLIMNLGLKKMLL
jgi:hypothetical protein